MVEISKDISRQVGLFINRRGRIDCVVVGDRGKIEIPDVATERSGRTRFRGVRFIHVHLEGELLTKEDLVDMATLHLDLIGAITYRKREGESIHIAHLIPGQKGERKWDFIGPVRLEELTVDFNELIRELENEYVRERGFSFALGSENDKAILISVVPPHKRKDVAESLSEVRSLCYSAGIDVADCVIQKPKELHPKYLIGKGKLEEVIMRSQDLDANVLIFDEELTPGQIKNISNITELKVIDRNQLILDIFAQRARTDEAKIQVELAQLNYILPRLSEKNTAFSRLTGGIGGRGPGETKLEVDKSRIRARIAAMEKRLEEIRKIRGRKREKRRVSNIPIVSIVGYTNSGKSTLLNLLTKSKVETRDTSFSTLTPTTRLIKYPERKNIILTDTVGFIKDLPEVLLKAFSATLEELEDADMLLHLVDIGSSDIEERIEVVEGLLKRLHLEEKKRLIVFNKIDRIEKNLIPLLEDRYNAVSISCTKREGLERLLGKIESTLYP
ncbi:MAG: GTPase HflX [Syntrophorhabdaceae bacterium]|nr:GTPase HflX [Syntrophorhabdaceae bacterium]